MRRVVSVVWPFAMLTIFVATFRRSAPEGVAAGAPAPCDDYGATRSVADAPRLERCVAFDPTDVDSLIALGDVSMAEAPYRRALEVEPRDARVHVRLGRLLLARGDRDGARREAEAALQSHVGNGAALRLIAEARAR